MDFPFPSKAAFTHAQQIFLEPHPTYGYEEIIRGVEVRFPDGRREKRDAVGNTFRGFYKIDKSKRGAKDVYDGFFCRHMSQVCDTLQHVQTRNQLHQIANEWRQEIVQDLSNIKPQHTQSYGKTRKPIDLYVMNLVSMAKELSSCRKSLIPLLFVPLDSQQFQKSFRPDELKPLGLSNKSTYGDVKSEADYLKLQEILQRQAEQASRGTEMTVYPIYFDIFWRDRENVIGGNLFEASPMKAGRSA